MQLKKFLNKKTPKKDKIRILSKMLKEAEANGGTISVKRAREVIRKDIESMDKDKIKKLLDDIDASCQEGWDDNQRGNFYTIMNITEEIKKELT